MDRSFALIVVMMMLTVGVAGCIGGDEEPPDPSEVQVDARRGALKGQVATIDLEPVADAKVVLVDASAQTVAQTTTDEEGRFVLDGLPPGEYKLQVIAHCCRSQIVPVTVQAGEIEESNLQLKRLSAAELEEPYVEENVWEGFISCGAGGGVPGVRNPKIALCAVPGAINESLADPNEDFILYFNMSKGLKSVVLGMDWEPVGGVSGRTFNLLFENGTCEEVACSDAYRYADLDGAPPLYARIDAEDINPDAVGARFEDIEEEADFKYRVFVGDGYAEVVYQQPFTVYWYEFYYEPAPEGFDPFPDT